jgi:thiamine-phosphate pyrophosphorylase
LKLPLLYPIIDFACFATRPDPVQAATSFAEELLLAGATLIQYRDKSSDSRRILNCAQELRRINQGRAMFILNDRVDLCLASAADGVHLGQDDLSPVAARKIFTAVGAPPSFAEKSSGISKLRGDGVGENQLLIGFSTHNLEQVREADSMPVDYVAIGPVFATGSKANPDPVIGLEGVRRAREATGKPLVAIGGITRNNCRQVREAGADSVAVIADLLESPAKAVEAFLRVLR